MKEDSSYSDEFFSFLSGKTSIAISRRFQRNLKEQNIPITTEQWSVLHYLWDEEGLTQQELANFTFRDKPSISRLIDNLEKIKLVKRISDETDRRTNLIYLTEKGRKIKEACLQQASKTISESLEGIDRSNLVIAQEILEKMYCNLT